jgi:hypothetical protein
MPAAGGYFDQPLGLMRRMNAALTVYNAFKGVRQLQEGNKNLVDLSAQVPELFEVVNSVEQMRDG